MKVSEEHGINLVDLFDKAIVLFMNNNSEVLIGLVSFYGGLIAAGMLFKGKSFLMSSGVGSWLKKRAERKISKEHINSLASKLAEKKVKDIISNKTVELQKTILELQSEIVSNNKEIKELKKDIEKRRKFSEYMEIDFNKKLGTKEEVYERVKEIVSFIKSEEKSKEINLTEALLIMKNIKDYTFFSREDAKIGFERNEVSVESDVFLIKESSSEYKSAENLSEEG